MERYHDLFEKKKKLNILFLILPIGFISLWLWSLPVIQIIITDKSQKTVTQTSVKVLVTIRQHQQNGEMFKYASNQNNV